MFPRSYFPGTGAEVITPPLQDGGGYFPFAYFAPSYFAPGYFPRKRLAVPLPPIPGIIDNVDAGYLEISGPWKDWPQGYNGNYRWINIGESGTVRWQVIGLPAGSYDVQITWVADPAFSSAAPHRIYDNTTLLQTVNINQTVEPTGSSFGGRPFQTIATVNITTGVLRIETEGTVAAGAIADAVRYASSTASPLPEIEVRDGGTLVLDGGSANFGPTPVGTPVSKTFTVKNIGTANLALTEPITVPAGFTVTQSFGATTLAPSVSTTFVVRMDAVAEGSPSGPLSFGNSDADENPFNFTVSGTVGAGQGQMSWTVAERYTGRGQVAQLVTFDVAPAVGINTHKLVRDGTTEIGYQRINGGNQIAVRIDLPGNSSRLYELVPGTPTAPPPANPVAYSETPEYHQFDNGLCGIRVWKQGTQANRPPVYGARHFGGQWVDSPSEVLANAVQSGAPVPAVSSKTVELGTYDFIRSLFTVETPGAWVSAARITYTFADSTIYTCLLWMSAGEPAVFFSERATTNLSWRVNFSPNPLPTQIRYRTEPNFTTENEIILVGAPAGTHSLPSWGYQGNDIKNIKGYMLLYHPDATVPGGADTWGVFQGRSSRMLGGRDGVSIWDTASAVGLLVDFNSVFSGSPEGRFEWGLWMGTKDTAYAAQGVLKAAMQNLINTYSTFGISKIYRYKGDHTVLSNNGAVWMSPDAMDALRVRCQDTSYRDALKAAVAGSGSGVTGFLHIVAIEYWWALANDLPNISVYVKNMYDDVLANVDKLAEQLVDFHGTLINPAMDAFATEAGRTLGLCDEILFSPHADAVQKAKIRAVKELYAQWFWDNDFAPFHPGAGADLGLPNQINMYLGRRQEASGHLADDFSQATPTDPPSGLTWDARATVVRDTLTASYLDTNLVAVDGSVPESLGNYWNPWIRDANRNLLQYQQAVGGVLTGTVLGRLKVHALWVMSMVTPPEPRFNTGRRTPAIGDGQTQSAALAELGKLATGLQISGDAAAQALGRAAISMWRKCKPTGALVGPIDGQDGPGYMWIDDAMADATPTEMTDLMVTRQFPSTFTVLWTGFDTANESKALFLSGNFRNGHAAVQDLGSFVFWALACPLSYDWGCFSAGAKHGYYHNMVLPEDGAGSVASVGAAWFADGISNVEDGGGLWSSFNSNQGDTTREVFNDKGHLTRPHYVKVKHVSPDAPNGVQWRRELQLFNTDPNFPTLAVQDTIRNATDSADDPVVRVATFTQMAQDNPVAAVPGGSYPIEVREWFHETNENVHVSPGPVRSLAAGVVHNFQFHGFDWVQHHSGGIDWDVWFYCPASAEYLIGNWSHNLATNQKDAFEAANPGQSWRERQHLLRFRSTARTTVVITAYRKGQRPAGLTADLTTNPGSLTVKHNGGTLAVVPLTFGAP